MRRHSRSFTVARGARSAPLLLALLLTVSSCQMQAPPDLSVTPTARTIQGAEVGMYVTVANATGSDVIDIVVGSSNPRLTPFPTSASLAAGQQVTISVLADRAGLESIDHGEVIVRSTSGDRVVDVTLMPRVSACDFGGTPSAESGRRLAPPSTLDASLLDRAAGMAVPGQVLVTYEPMTTSMDVISNAAARSDATATVAARVGARVLRRGLGSEHDLLEVPAHDMERVLAELLADPLVRRAAPNAYVSRLAAPNDEHYPSQWSLRCFGAEEAWQVEFGSGSGEPVVVSIVDDGANLSHVDLVDKLVPGWDFYGDDDDVSTMSDHGSHVASIAAATGNNSVGIAGVGFGTRVLVQPVKVFPDGESESTTTDVVLRGLRWAGGLEVTGASPTNATPGDVINLSLGFGTTPSSALVGMFEDAVAEIHAGDKRSLVVAATGNHAGGLECLSSGVQYPARVSSIVAVGSLDHDMARSCFSDYGAGLDLMAPGGLAPPDVPSVNGRCMGILGAGVGSSDELVCLQGTSMAAPYVSGAAALLIAHDEELRDEPEQLRERLRSTALRPPTYAADQYGAGVLCVDAALGAASTCGD